MISELYGASYSVLAADRNWRQVMALPLPLVLLSKSELVFLPRSKLLYVFTSVARG
jgi:hypothetical protein